MKSRNSWWKEAVSYIRTEQVHLPQIHSQMTKFFLSLFKCSLCPTHHIFFIRFGHSDNVLYTVFGTDNFSTINLC
jgi:hypothetical protein